jgi:hypothetical protein
VGVVPELNVVAVGLDPAGAQPVLLLEEIAGRHRRLPVLIGLPEAGALELQRHGISLRRPQTHDLICEVISACGRRLERVRITELRDGIFHAELVFDRDDRVSARLTDAVTLAVRLGIPILVEEDVLEAGHSPVEVVQLDSRAEESEEEYGTGEYGREEPAETPAPDPDELERFRRFLDDASPEDFDKEE